MREPAAAQPAALAAAVPAARARLRLALPVVRTGAGKGRTESVRRPRSRRSAAPISALSSASCRARTPAAWDLVRNSLDLGGISFDSHEEAHAAAKTLLARLRAQKEAAALQLHEAHFVGSRAEHRDNFVLGFQNISYFNAGLEALIGPPDSRIMDAMRGLREMFL